MNKEMILTSMLRGNLNVTFDSDLTMDEMCGVLNRNEPKSATERHEVQTAFVAKWLNDTADALVALNRKAKKK